MSQQFEVWQDTRRLRTRHPWDEQIEAAILQSNVVLFLMTPHAVRVAKTADDRKDSVCRDELAFARAHNIPILPVRVQPCETPLLIHRLQHVEIPAWESAAGYAAGVERIRAAIARVLRGEPVPERIWGLAPPFSFEALIRAKLQRFTGREWLFKEVSRWLRAHRGQGLLIVGDPGSGKSAAAAALARSDPDGRLLAYHFCDSATPETIDPAAFVRGLASQLAARLDDFAGMAADPEIERVLARAEADPASVFETAIIGLLNKVSAPDGGVRYLLIDALDEALTETRPTIVDILAVRLDRLPRWLKVVSTTRPEPAVLERFGGVHRLTIDAEGRLNRGDVKRFIEGRLAEPDMRRQLKATRRGIDQVAQPLLDASEGNFLAIETALQAVELRLITLEEAEGLSPGLESRYRFFFERMFPGAPADFAHARRVLEVLVAAREPLCLPELRAMAGLADDEMFGQVLRRLSCFVPGHGDRFKLVHKTLGDWLGASHNGLPKAGPFAVSAERGLARIADWCWAEYRSGRQSTSDYSVRHLPMHLARLGRTDALEQLLFDFAWLDAKARRLGMGAVLSDCTLRPTEVVKWLAVALRSANAAGAVSGHALAEQVLARLPDDGSPALESLRSQAARAVGPTAFRSLFSTMTMSGLIVSLEKPPQDLSTVALADAGRVIAGRSSDGAVIAWDAATGRVATVRSTPTPRWPAPKRPRLPIRRRLESLAGRGSPVRVACSDDGSRVSAAWGDGTLCSYDVHEPERIRATRGHVHAPEFLQFIDDDRFVSHERFDGTDRAHGESKVWDFHSLGSLPARNAHLDWIRAVSISTDGSFAATVSVDRRLRVWDMATGRATRELNVTTNSVGAVAIGADCRSILTGDRQHCLKLWDLDGMTVRAWIPTRPDEGDAEQRQVYCINAVAFTGTRRQAIVAADGLYAVDTEVAWSRVPAVPVDEFDAGQWDRIAGEPCLPFEGVSAEIYCLAVAPDESVVIGAGGAIGAGSSGQPVPIFVWDVRSRTLVGRLNGHRHGVTSLAITRCDDALCALSASADGTVIVWNLARRKPVRVLKGHTGVVRAVAVTPDGRHAVSAGSDRTLRLWSLRTGTEVGLLPGDAGFSACAFSDDGKHLVAGDISGGVHFFNPRFSF